jgi:hypothetical protein
MKMSDTRCFDLLKAVLDPTDRWWWTAFGLIALTRLSKSDEGRYWATVYLSAVLRVPNPRIQSALRRQLAGRDS